MGDAGFFLRLNIWDHLEYHRMAFATVLLLSCENGLVMSEFWFCLRLILLAAFATKVPPHIAETVYIKLSISLFRSCVFQGQLSARLILTPAADDDEEVVRPRRRRKCN